jgi:hypothetical protein
MTFVTISRGIDINAVAMKLLGDDHAIFDASASTTSTIASTEPIDFVGGMMNVIGVRIGIWTKSTATSSDATTTDVSLIASSTTSTPAVSLDSYASGFMKSIFSAINKWLADAGNGIRDFFADRVHTKEICVSDESGETCVTKIQLDALLATAGQAASGASGGGDSSPVLGGGVSSGAESATSTPPVIQINGNATSTIEVGDVYLDLGARITAPESDLNLGIEVLLDGATTTAVSIDTSIAGAHTIVYSVTSPTSGLTGTAERIVIVGILASPSPITPSPDTIATSTATSTAQ